MTTFPLAPHHAAQLAASTVDPAGPIATERGYCTVTTAAELAQVDGQLAGYQRRIPALVVPIYKLGQRYTTVIRPDSPRIIVKPSGKKETMKYEWPEGVALCFDVLPRYRDDLDNPSIPIWFTEGAKKADALATINRGILPISWSYDRTAERWRRWTGTHWEAEGERSTRLDGQAAQVLRELGMRITSNGKVDGVIRLAATQCERDFAPALGLVNFRNGTLNTVTGQLRPHRRDDDLTYCLPYDYAPAADWPAIRAFLEATIPEPVDRQTYAAHVGLALLRDTKLHKALLLYGPPRSGKSTLLQLANLIAGNEPTANAGPELFDRETEGLRSRMVWNGRRLVTLEELPSEALRSEELVKAMTAHGGVAQRRMHRLEETSNQWTPKLLMATNEPPRYSDRTGALTERLLYVRCPNHRPEDQRDIHLLDKLTAELGGFAAHCVAMAQAILAIGRYPETGQYLSHRSTSCSPPCPSASASTCGCTCGATATSTRPRPASAASAASATAWTINPPGLRCKRSPPLRTAPPRQEHIMTPTPTSEHTPRPRCAATKANGERCGAYALMGSAYCFHHDPASRAVAQAARSAGGQARASPTPAPPIQLGSIADQLEALQQTINRVRAGQEPLGVARLVLYGISLARPLVELGELEERLAALEEKYAAQ